MRISVFLILVLFSSCSPVLDRTVQSSSEEIELREKAGEMYEALWQESCPPISIYPRSELFADLARKIEQSESRWAGSSLGQQIQLAKQKTAFRRHLGDLGCWADNDERFAKKHLAWARTDIEQFLAKAEKSDIADVAENLVIDPMLADSAEFRIRVEDLVGSLTPLCQLSTQANNRDVVSSARQMVDAFRQEIGHSPFATHFDIAREDAEFRLSRILVECAEAGTESRDQLETELLDATRRMLAGLRQLSGKP